MAPWQDKIGLGGGCHWCTEAVFQALRGVTSVAQGFVRSDPPHDSWSEAVDVTFDPGEISLPTLIEVHLRTHASNSEHKFRVKYRSAIYVHDAAQRAAVEAALANLQKHFQAPLVTMVLPHRGFKASDARFHNYYANGPERPFCQRYIDPKLDLLRRQFARAMKSP